MRTASVTQASGGVRGDTENADPPANAGEADQHETRSCRTAAFSNKIGQPCTTVELAGLGLDRGLPLSPTGVRTRCDINPDTHWSGLFTVAVWLVQAAVWGLATLALAGYTGLVRKTG